MVCPKCRYTNAPDEENCVRCGTPLMPGGSFVQERRWVSAVFFDLSRFTEYALAHPLEDTWQAVNTALQSASNHVRAFGGHIDKFFGDGFLAVFGVPRSQESDARAALEAARLMVGSSPLPSRAGVASGLVLRTPLGGGLAGDQTVLGPAINLSQRLSGAAPPGVVWTDNVTVRLLPTGRFEALPAQPLKGYAEPLIPFRYEGLRSGPLEVVGREAELEVLRLALAAAVRGEGRRVVLHGAMGVGKSYLAQHFVATLPAGARGLVAPRLTTGVALRYALRQGLQDLLPEGLARLRGLELPDPLREVLNFSIGIDENPGMSTDELNSLLVETWWQVLARLGREAPLVVVLEDLHNADPTVLEFTRRKAPDGVVLVLVARQNRWGQEGDLVPLLLQPLPLEQTQRLILQVRPDLGPATSLHLSEASGGFPLAVQALGLTASGEPEPIPLYQPRLDTLPRLARIALQAAAVLGPSSPPELVRHLIGQEADLARLVGDGFLEADEQGMLRFVIPWLREATLGQVAGQQVQQWHLQAARWYQRQERLAEAAVHLEAAGEMASAYRMWRVIAQQLWNEERFAEAVGGYLEALRLAEGNVRHSAALEAAEAHLMLGRYQEALDLASLPLESTDLPAGLSQRVWAVRLEAALELGVSELGDLPEGLEPTEPRLRLALAQKVSGTEARVLLSNMPPNLEGAALLVRAIGLLNMGNAAQAQALSQLYLDEHFGNPALRFKAQMLAADSLWRQFKLHDALQTLAERPGPSLPSAHTADFEAALARLRLELGEYPEAKARLGAALEQVADAPPPVKERVGVVYLRYLIEVGEIPEAIRFGESLVALAPTPRLLAHLALAYALSPGDLSRQMLARLLRGLEDNPDLEIRALCELASGIGLLENPLEAAPHLREAQRLARQAQHPSFFFYSLLLLGLSQQGRNPKKALAAAQYLLSQTAGRGFKVQNALARLLRAHLLMDEGRDPLTLLEFETAMPFARYWRLRLLERMTHQDPSRPAPRPPNLLELWRDWYAVSAEVTGS
ncbi:MAG: AAA family ATPase [Meiothermus sp.]|nr:AAA family ATPase [Meiothermus sp.]